MIARRLRMIVLALAMTVLALAATAGPAHAVSVHPWAPYGPCGDHFQLTRSGTEVHVVGVDLSAFEIGYMLVFGSDDHNKSYGPYNASSYGGANFVMYTGRTSSQYFRIALTNYTDTETLCASSYYA